MTRIIILGGGYGGVEAAKKLHKKYKRKKNVEITLIDKNPYHTLMTELHEVAGGRVEPDSVRISFDRIFSGKNVDVVTDEIKDIDFDKKICKSETNQYEYDYLVLAVGAEPEDFGIPGVKEHAMTLWSFDDAIQIRRHVRDMFLQASRETDPEKRKKLLRFTVAGAGFTGMELAGEFLEWKYVLAEEFRVNVEEVNVQVVEMLPHVLPILPDKLQKKAQKYMEKKGCEFILDSPIIRAEEGKIHTKDGTVIETNTFIWTCGVQGCEFAANLDLTLGKCSNKQCSYATEQGTCGIKDCQFVKEEREIDGKRGRLLVNDMMQSVDYEHVYLIGDVIWYQIDEKVIPQIVETAIQTAETAAKNIIADIENKEKKKHEASYHGFMVSLGGKYGVAHVMGLSLTGIFAMGMKHMINILHLFGVAGVNASWGYIKHEFLNIKHNRSFIRGLLSTKVPVYWVAVLRVFLGVMWLIEGVKKVFDGWLNPDNIYIIATEATSSATPAEGAGEQSWTAVEPLLEEPLYIYDWMVDVIISKAPFFFQATVVLAEIAIGLALIAGLFTFLAALASIGLSIMFTISAMASKEIFWYIFAAIPMLGGAGKGSGLDHWVMPFCKKLWNSTPIAKATYLYVDEPKNVKKKKGK